MRVCARAFRTWSERSVARARVRTQSAPGIARPRAFGHADPHWCALAVRGPLDTCGRVVVANAFVCQHCVSKSGVLYVCTFIALMTLSTHLRACRRSGAGRIPPPEPCILAPSCRSAASTGTGTTPRSSTRPADPTGGCAHRMRAVSPVDVSLHRPARVAPPRRSGLVRFRRTSSSFALPALGRP